MFCGAGGSSAGARAAGMEIAAGIDMWPLATSTFTANFPGAKVITSRLEDLHLDSIKKQIGTIDLLLASPECTNHTCAKGGAQRNEESRETALLVVDYARAFRPRWLVLENVVHMRPWSRYEELKHALRTLGYHLQEHILDAVDFGVAQTRRRLFLVGDLKEEPASTIPGRCGQRKPTRTILDPAGVWKMSPLFHERRAAATLERAHRGFDALGETASFLLVYYGNDGSGGWQPLSRPLRTITTLDRFALVTHDGSMPRMRMLQVPELKRAMSFHEVGCYEELVLPIGTRRDRIRLTGNGVCPPVMEAVVRSLTAAS